MAAILVASAKVAAVIVVGSSKTGPSVCVLFIGLRPLKSSTELTNALFVVTSAVVFTEVMLDEKSASRDEPGTTALEIVRVGDVAPKGSAARAEVVANSVNRIEVVRCDMISDVVVRTSVVRF